MKRFTCVVLVLVAGAAALLAPLSAFAVSTSYWTQTSEADFKGGTLEGVVATNLGDLKLSRAVKVLLEQDPQISTVNRLAEAPDGTIYAGTGPNAVLIQIKDQKVSPVATIEDATDILSLTFDHNGRLLIGTAGEKGKILRIDKAGEKPHAIFSADNVQYIWAMAATADGNVYAATGPEGKLFEIKPDGTSKVLFESEENNILSLISDGKDLLYAGTDPHGLVYRVNRKTGDSFVVFNAAEAEVTALALDKKGNLYAATGEARDDTGPMAPGNAEQEKVGRPEGGATGVPIPGEKPQQPNPPAPPDPNPGRPDPIPKGPSASLPHAPRQTGMVPVIYAMAAEPGSLDNPKHNNPHPGQPAPKPAPGKPQPVPPAPPQTAPAQTTTPAAPGHQPAVDVNGTGEPRPEGNAVYKIDVDGFVTEIFRQPVLVLGMVEINGTLLLATGSEGQVYQVDPSADETVVLAKTDAKQVMCLLPARDGNIYLGMANVGSIAAMSSGYADKGTFTSPVLDATQISRFGRMQLRGSLPTESTLLVSTRSGNVRDISEKSWSKWTDAVPATEFLPVESPSARFLQYRLTLTSKDGKSTPVVDDVTIAYQIPNMPPQIKGIRIATGADATNPGTDTDPRLLEPTRKLQIAWEASDPNNDILQYSLFFRRGTQEPWILLKDKLTEMTFEWDTRSVADGRYQVKVIASDAASNPPGTGKSASRVSDPVLIDNTAPIIGDLKWVQKGPAIHVELRAFDRSSTVAAVDYVLDSAKEWQLVLPTDGIYDSPEETFSFDIRGLTPGQHQVALRATDSKGNQSFENLLVKVEGPAAAR